MIRVILEGAVKRYGRTTAVDRASLELGPGGLTVVVGPAGAGKTTLARLIAGLEPVDDGEVYFDDKLMLGVPVGKRQVGLIAGEGSLWPGLTVAENVAYPLKSWGLSKADRREKVREMLNQFRIETLADRTPDRLDPIQSLRAAMARALVCRPNLLIFDEPLGSLDPGRSDEVLSDLKAAQSNHSVTILVLTRDVRRSMGMADRLAVMDLGRVVQAGPPQDLYNRPSDVFVARFLGPVNLLQGQVDGTGGNPHGDVVVRTPLGRLVGRADAGAMASGTPVTIAIRPEALTLGGNVPTGSNRFPATVERISFQGQLRHISLRGPSDWPVQAVALQSQSRHLREGLVLTLSVSPEYVVILPGTFSVNAGGVSS
jgi:ABC-type Fe3+/spermidine/putrescine transport system ATPase subunit